MVLVRANEASSEIIATAETNERLMQTLAFGLQPTLIRAGIRLR